MTCSRSEVNVSRVSLEALLPLRTRVLRPHFEAPRMALFEGDDDEHTWHMGMRLDGELVGCVTMMRRPAPGEQDVPEAWRATAAQRSWQLRGMAVDATCRGEGHGTLLLEHLLAEVREHDASTLVWCNAREAAITLYARAGFVQVGEHFDVPVIGSHVLMGVMV